MDSFELLFGLKLGYPRISIGLNYILKNWDHEKESYEEWYLRTYHNQPERLSEKDRKVCDSPNTPTKGSELDRNV